MTFSISILLDVILVVLLCYCAYAGYKGGFLKTIVKFVGYISAVLIAFIGSRLLSTFLCEMSRDFLLNFSIKHLGDVQNGTPAQAVEKMYASMPKFITNAARFFFGSSEDITQKLAEGSQSAAEGITDLILMPIVEILLQTILFLIILGICMFLVRRIVKASSIIRRIPLLGSVNALFGGVLGLAQGALIIIILVGILNFAVAVTGWDQTWFTPEMIEKTYLFRYVYDITPLVFGIEV